MTDVADDDDFFASGGHSISAVRLINLIDRELGVTLGIADVFENPRLGQQVDLISASGRLPKRDISRISAGQEFLSITQSARYRRAVENPAVVAPPHENYLTLLHFRGALDAIALDAAVAAVLRRHDVLRTRCRAGSAGAVAEPGPVPEHPLRVVELPPGAAPDEVIAAESSVRHDVHRGPLSRTTLIRLAADEHILVWSVHALAHDGWASRRVLLAELAECYQAALGGWELPPLERGFADFARWQREWLTGPRLDALLGYWTERLGEAGPVPALRIPGVPEPDGPIRGRRTGRVVPAAVADRLPRLYAERRTTLFTVGLAAVFGVLARYTGTERVAVLAPVANRERAGFAEVVGPLSHLAVFSAEVAVFEGVASMLDLTRASVEKTLAHQEIPHDLLVDHLRAGAWPHRTVVFTARREDGEPVRLGDAVGTPMRPEPVMENLSLMLVERPGELELTAEYDANWLPDSLVESLLEDVEGLLAALVLTPGRPIAQVVPSRGPVLAGEHR